MYDAQCVWIDAGNHRDSGQVCLGDSAKNTTPIHPNAQGEYQYLPTPSRLLPSLLEPEPPVQTSAQSQLCRAHAARGARSVD